MKKKKRIIGIILILILITIGGLFFLFNKKEKQITYDSINAKINIDCNKIDDYSYNNQIFPNDKISCNIFLYNQSEKDFIWEEIKATYELDKDIKYLDISGSNLTNTQNKITIIKDKGELAKGSSGISSTGVQLFSLKLQIPNVVSKEKITIKIKDLQIKTNDKQNHDIKDAIYEIYINKENDYKYVINKEHSQILFYKYDNGYQKINEYNCENECYPEIQQCFSFEDYEKGKTAIRDGKKIIFFDYHKGILGEYGENVYPLYDETYHAKYYYVENLKNQKYGIIDNDGKIIKDFIFEDKFPMIGCNILHDTYSIKYNLIVVEKNNKYGISKLTENKKIIDYLYDSIRLYNDKYYKAKIGDKWYLYSFNKTEKQIEDGYKEIFFITDEIIATQIDDKLYLKDYNGNNLIQEPIKTYMEYNEFSCCGTTKGIDIEYQQDTKKIKIFISKETAKDNYYETETYEYSVHDLIK